MAKATVLTDLYRYHQETGDPTSTVLEAEQGKTIDVSDDELKRGVELGALSTGSSTSTAWKDVKPEQMDAFASANDVADYPTDGKKPAKVSALEAAGHDAGTVAAFELTKPDGDPVNE
jgi:hypothetical protein